MKYNEKYTIIISFLLVLSSMFINITFAYLFAIFLVIILSLYRKKYIYYFYIISVLTTEFIYIEILGGVVRPYHFFGVIVFLINIKYIPRLLEIKPFRYLLVILLVAFFSSLLSPYSVAGALISFISLMLNAILLINISLILISRRMNITELFNLLNLILVISILWGFIQFILMQYFGVNIGLSAEQISQINAGLIPGFRTESNTFGKYIAVMLMYNIVVFVYRRKDYKNLLVLVLILFTSILNFTRTAAYGIILTSPFIILVYLKKRNILSLIKFILIISTTLVLTYILVANDILPGGEYISYKLEAVFDFTSISSDQSGSYRINNMLLLVEGSFDSIHTIIFGKGWGQTYYYVGNELTQIGGNDILSFYGFTGLLGVFIYFLLLQSSLSGMKSNGFTNPRYVIAQRAVGLQLILIIFIGLFSGMLISPEYWLIFGVVFYIQYINSNPRLKKDINHL